MNINGKAKIVSSITKNKKLNEKEKMEIAAYILLNVCDKNNYKKIDGIVQDIIMLL
jgi:hypothetical protein